MRIIIGLGNPSEKYKLTRHNAGFMAVDAIAARHGSAWQYNKKFKAEITSPQPSPSQGEGERERFILVKPQSFMNNSGQAVQAILSYYKLLPKKFGIIKAKNSDLSNVLTVIHDDIDIELGKYKISVDSRSAGHKGVESIINYLKTKNFKRIRIGIKTEMADKIPVDKFVLQKFSEEELKIVNNTIADLAARLI
ncbi:aminoacyl-tRNA hydrolase [Patescibacteria group bacterium]|nr:aminoacyl-tRNA hydrolase [Patescibacteria group bacterium]